MTNQLEELFAMVDNSAFEKLSLLYESYVDNNVISFDTNLFNTVKYYELWDSINGKLTLLVIYLDPEIKFSKRSLMASDPGYDEYILKQPTNPEKWLLLEWLFDQDTDSIPPSLREIKKITDSLSNIFEHQFLQSNYSKYFPED